MARRTESIGICVKGGGVRCATSFSVILRPDLASRTQIREASECQIGIDVLTQKEDSDIELLRNTLKSI